VHCKIPKEYICQKLCRLSSQYAPRCSGLPTDSTPGLSFLKAYLSRIDDLSPETHKARLEKLFHSLSIIRNNETVPVFTHPPQILHKRLKENPNLRFYPTPIPLPPEPIADAETEPQKEATKVEKRSNAVESLTRKVLCVHEMERADGKRTVIRESEIEFRFKADPEHPVVMAQADIMELERTRKRDMEWMATG
jgi:hypothetical protein